MAMGCNDWSGTGFLDTIVSIRYCTYIYGNRINQLGYGLRDISGNESLHIDSIYCPAFDTTIYTIHF